jgi:CelD/BcsL family acetyltransferase involved in cellulose biosynthesis
LGVREGDLPHIAFVPLSYTRSLLSGRVLSLGPSPRSDFTGMLGVPGKERRFIPVLAQEIQRLPWDSLALNNCADRRVESLLGEFGPSSFRIVPGDPTGCPFVQLPATWDEYLRTRGSSTRRTLRSHLNRIHSLPGYRLHFASPSESREAIETLLRFHSLRWKRNLAKSRRALGDFLVRCAASGRFVVCGIHQGDKVIAMQGLFVEQRRRTIVAYMIAHNPEYAQYSPGVMLGCESLRRAIEDGYHHYSFSRGDQGYKMSLATDVQYLTNTMLWRRSIRAAAIEGGRRALSAAKSLARRVFRGWSGPRQARETSPAAAHNVASPSKRDGSQHRG